MYKRKAIVELAVHWWSVHDATHDRVGGIVLERHLPAPLLGPGLE